MPAQRDTSTGDDSPAAPTPATPETQPPGQHNPLPHEPSRRRHQTLRGRPLRDRFGTDWIIADIGLADDFEPWRNRAFDMLALQARGDLNLYRPVAMCALMANYQLDDEEAALIIRNVTPQELIEVTAEALLPTQEFVRSYTTWMLSALIACNIDPQTVPRHLLPGVIRHLEYARRIEPHNSFVNSAADAAKRSKVFGGI